MDDPDCPDEAPLDAAAARIDDNVPDDIKATIIAGQALVAVLRAKDKADAEAMAATSERPADD
jgi:hypothetical protein